MKIIDDSRILESISTHQDSSVLELLAITFSDAVSSLVKIGLSKRLEEILRISSSKDGTVAIFDWITRGLVPPTSKFVIKASFDNAPNRILKSVLKWLSTAITSSKLRARISILLSSFADVRDVDLRDIKFSEVNLSHYTILRRDYERSLMLAQAILSGGIEDELDLTAKRDYIPPFTLDFDRVFEEFCYQGLKKILSPDHFFVSYQMSFDHVVKPKIKNTMTADITIKNKATEKIILIDAKNKYSIGNADIRNVSNVDLYQLLHYKRTLGAANAYLLYPGSRPKFQFPIRASESQTAYLKKVEAALSKKDRRQYEFFYDEDNSEQIELYEIDLSGTLNNTLASLAGLAVKIDLETR